MNVVSSSAMFSERPKPPAGQMAVQVLFFAQLREQIGKDAVWVVLPDGADGAALLRSCFPQHHEAIGSWVRLAVNQRFETVLQPLHDGDVVALLTPVAGG